MTVVVVVTGPVVVEPGEVVVVADVVVVESVEVLVEPATVVAGAARASPADDPGDPLRASTATKAVAGIHAGETGRGGLTA
ncbi:MAG: hypothetical protein ACRDZM_01725 [Acidimicrobiia bacterium]